ncbi:MAG: type I pullulanase [Lachnospiraceae bacterium]|nr:type I pullulanase [Lachnospiraceae bacterium]
MKKKLKALLLATVMLFTTVASLLGDATVVRADDLVLKLHYNRPDGNYTDWSVWFWEIGGEGVDIPLVEENGEMVATKVVTPGVSELGYIVRTPDWTKDIDKDQFINVAECISGTVHMYVESGVEGCTKVYGDDVVIGTKLTAASYLDGKVNVTMTKALEDTTNAFTVSGKEGEVAIAAITGEGPEYVLEMAEPFDLSQKYNITFDGNSYAITMPDYYSTEEFEALYTYTGDDLGATWTKDATTFRVWAPTAEAVSVKLFETGASSVNSLIEELPMTADANGTWILTKSGDLNGVYYTYNVTIDGVTREACDPYARTTGVNGDRAMVIDLDSTDPQGWADDKNPNADLAFNDAIIYELHVRDLGTDSSSGIKRPGKFLSLTEHGTTTENGVPTGIDHIKSLGITHLHILPMYDFASVVEGAPSGQFNWGYDPQNYNVPEGSYSTDPFNGAVRVKEAKEMVQSLHNDGISVVMDVVYNHVSSAGDFCFNRIVPQYFSRVDATGKYSNGSGCGNDTASERSMVKKYIVDSVLYWATEYHIDGFRFDLVGLIDTETINEIMETVHAVRPDVVFYGEGWTMSTTMTKEGYTLTTQPNSLEVPGFAFFNDNIRDGLRGNVFNNEETGYVSGASDLELTIEDAFLGSSGTWCHTPTQTVNYASCHDNMTLFDRLQNSRPDASKEDIIKMNNLAATIYMTAQGIPFIHAGEDMLRTKVKEDGTFDHNSYSSGDEINSLKWDTLEDETYANVVEYYRGLIAFRKAHPVLRLTTPEAVSEHVSVVDTETKNVTAFALTGGVEGETADAMYIIFNPNTESTDITLPEGDWDVYINAESAGTNVLATVNGTVTIDAISAMVLVQGDAAPSGGASNDATSGTASAYSGSGAALLALVAMAALLVGARAIAHKKH